MSTFFPFASLKDALKTRTPSHGLGRIPKVALSFTPSLCICAFNSFTTKDQLLAPGMLGESSEPFHAPEDESHRECRASDSDSDGPVLYTDDDDDDDEEDEDEDGSGESKTFFQEAGREVEGG